VKPILGGPNLILAKLAAAMSPRDCDVCAAALEDCCEFLGLSRRNEGILLCGADEDRKMAKVPNYLRYQGHHRSEENCACEVMRVKQNQARGEVRAVCVTNHNQLPLAEPVSFGSSTDELRQFLCSGPHITDTRVGEAPKRVRHALFQDFPSQTEESGAWPEFISNGQERALIATGTMQNSLTSLR
jgi:hypothetical protein